MGRIVAIGGGEIITKSNVSETLEIDIEIKNMTRKNHPRLLFIPTASSDASAYTTAISSYFGEKLGCQVSNLEVLNKTHLKKDLEKSISNTDIVYVGGGNTKLMLDRWKEIGLDQILVRAFNETEIILSGLSAGAICWFKYGSSDSNKFRDPDAKLMCLPCLNLINLAICPHYNVEADRKESFKEILHTTMKTGIGLDNCCALKIVDDTFQIITSHIDANAYVSRWINGTYHEIKLENGKFGQLQDLQNMTILDH